MDHRSMFRVLSFLIAPLYYFSLSLFSLFSSPSSSSSSSSSSFSLLLHSQTTGTAVTDRSYGLSIIHFIDILIICHWCHFGYANCHWFFFIQKGLPGCYSQGGDKCHINLPRPLQPQCDISEMVLQPKTLQDSCRKRYHISLCIAVNSVNCVLLIRFLCLCYSHESD